jgi:hypothetical protein
VLVGECQESEHRIGEARESFVSEILVDERFFDPRRVMEIIFDVARLGESLSRRHTRHGEKFSTGTQTSSSASAPHSDESSATPPNPVRQNAERILAFAGF